MTESTTYELMFQMLEHCSDAFVIFDTKTEAVLYLNKLAKEHFVLTNERANKDFFQRIESQFQRREIAVFQNTPMGGVDGNIIYSNIQAGYLDEEKAKIWAKVTPIATDLKMKQVLDQNDSQLIYLEAVPRLYSDIIFRLDPKTRRLTHAGDLVLQFGLPRILEDFPKCLEQSDVIHSDDLENYMVYAYDLLEGKTGKHVLRIRLLDNTFEWFSIETTAVRDINGNFLEIMGKLTNIQANKLLEEFASFDTLTNTLLHDSFQNLVSEGLGKEEGAFLLVDIDGFDDINNRLGHEFGNNFLKEVGSRLNNCVRDSDFVGRVNGDQFAIFLKKMVDPSVVERKIKQLLKITDKTVRDEKGSTDFTLSIGMARYPNHADTYDNLYKLAEKALLTAKKRGGAMACLCKNMKNDYIVLSVADEQKLFQNALGMLDNNVSAFVVFHKHSHEVVSENKKARDMFFNENHEFNVNEVFDSEERVWQIIKKVQDELALTQLVAFSDEFLTQNTGEGIPCDLEFSYISDDKIYVYLKITPKANKKEQLMKTLIEKMTIPVVTLHPDENLTIGYGNSLFYEDFSCNEKNFYELYGDNFLGLILPELREKFSSKLKAAFQNETKGVFAEAILFANGETRWLSFDCKKLNQMDTGNKIYCQITAEKPDSH